MTSTMRLGSLVLACGAFAAVGCRMDPVTGVDVVQHDATGTDVVHTDVPPGTDVQMMNVDVPPGTDVQPLGDGSMHTSVTIEQVQNLASAGHPAPGSVLTLNQTGLIALTPRLLIGSASGNSSGQCRFGVWVGDSTMSGPFTGAIVEELVAKGDAGSCFDAPARQLPSTVLPGDAISLIDGATYDEFCAGPTGVTGAACANWEQTEIFGPRVFTVGAHGAAPTPAPVTTAMIGVAADGTPQPATLTYEGVLVRLSGVHLTATTTMSDGGASFSTFVVNDPADPAHTLQIDVVNFPHTNCVRSYLNAQNGMSLASVTGVLVPDFGVWKVRVRDENDIGGIGSCASDGGAAIDGG